MKKLVKRILSKMKPSSRMWSVLFCTAVANLGAFCLGFGLGYPSPVESNLKTSGVLNSFTFPIFTSVYIFAAGIGSIIFAPFITQAGRKTLIIMASAVAACGWAILTIPTSPTLILGRIISGVGAGAVSSLIPVYVGEIAESGTTGFFGSFFPHYLRFGVISVYVGGIFISHAWLAIIPCIVLIILLILMPFQPNSPYWFMKREFPKRARASLCYLRGAQYDVDSELRMIAEVCSKQETLQNKLQSIVKISNLKALIIGCTYLLFAQITGITIINAYAAELLSNNQFFSANIAAVFLPCVEIVASSLLADRIGRKLLTILSGVGISSAYALLTLYFMFTQYTQLLDTNEYTTLWPLISLCLFNSSFSLGWGSMGWVIMGEIFPTQIKNIAASIGGLILWISGGVFALLFPYYDSIVGRNYSFLTLFVMNVIGVIFAIVFIPETKGKTPTEIENLFEEKTIFLGRGCCSFERQYTLSLKGKTPTEIENLSEKKTIFLGRGCCSSERQYTLSPE